MMVASRRTRTATTARIMPSPQLPAVAMAGSSTTMTSRPRTCAAVVRRHREESLCRLRLRRSALFRPKSQRRCPRSTERRPLLGLCAKRAKRTRCSTTMATAVIPKNSTGSLRSRAPQTARPPSWPRTRFRPARAAIPLKRMATPARARSLSSLLTALNQKGAPRNHFETCPVSTDASRARARRAISY